MNLAVARPSPIRRGYLLGIASSASMGLIFIFSKAALATLNRETLAPLWYFASLLMALAYLILTEQVHSLLIPRRLWLPILLMGLFNSIGAIAFFWEIQVTDPTLISFFGRMEPVYTVVWGTLFLNERLNRREMLGIVVTLGGALLITYASGQIVLQAFLLSIFVETLFFSLGILVTKLALERAATPGALVSYRSLLMCLFTAAYALIAGKWTSPHPRELLLIGGGAFFGPFLSWLLLMIALTHADASKLAIIRNLQPLFVVLYSLVILGTAPTSRQMLGGAATVAGVLLILSARAPKE